MGAAQPHRKFQGVPPPPPGIFCYMQDDSSADGSYNTQVHMYFVDTMDSEIAVNDQQGSGLYGDGKQDNYLAEEKARKTVRSKSVRMKSDNLLRLSQETAHKLVNTVAHQSNVADE